MLATNRILNQIDPWKMFDQLRDWDDQVRTLIAGTGASFEGALNLWTTDDRAVVEMELPGREPGDIDVSVHNNQVQVVAKSAPENLPEGARYLRRERPQADVTRTLNLPFELDPEKVDAVFEKGILKVTLHRHAASLPAKIAVKAG